MSGMKAFLLLAVLVPAARAANYDPEPDRAALRHAAASCHSTVVDATGLPLLPEKAAAIGAGLDEGLRLARLAAVIARSLDDAAKARAAAMEAGTKDAALDGKIKELAAPVAEQSARLKKLASEQAELEAKVDALPEEERKKLKPLAAKSAGLLARAGSALAPLDDALKAMAAAAPEMKDQKKRALGPLAELTAAAAGVVRAADEYAGPLDEAKARLGNLAQEPREAARARAWEKLALLRDAVVSLFQFADRACNRADDFRRRSEAYGDAAGAFEKARAAAVSGPGAAKDLLDAAHASQARLREKLPG